MTEQQKSYLKKNQMEYGINKDEARYLITSKKIDNSYCQLYNDIKQAWNETADFRQTSVGLNHYRRDVLIADFDSSANDFNQVFSSLDLPEFSYVLENPDSGHIQAGYFLNEPFIWTDYNTDQKESYLMCKRILNSYCPDNGYRGWRCKNPFCKDFNVSFTDNTYDKEYLLHKLLLIKPKKQTKTIKNKNNKIIIRKCDFLGEKWDRAAGRNNYFLYKTTRFYSDSKVKGIELTESELLEWLRKNETDLRNELLVLNPAAINQPLELNQLKTIVHSAYRYVEKNFNMNKGKAGFTKLQRENALELRRLNRERHFVEFCNLKEIGYKNYEIATALGLHVNTITKFNKMYKQMITDNTYKDFRIMNGYKSVI